MKRNGMIAVACMMVAHGAYADPATTPAPAPTVEQSKPLPVFSFRGEDTETPRSDKSTAEGCIYDEDEKAICIEPFVMAGGVALDQLTKHYSHNKLYGLAALLSTKDVQTLADAFSAKYGPPSKIEVRKWQSNGGATFDNTVEIWYFKGGELDLESIGPDVNTAKFTFISLTNAPPLEKPTVDF
jgi:hypothetical protein